MYRRSGTLLVVLLVAMAGCVGSFDAIPGAGDGGDSGSGDGEGDSGGGDGDSTDGDSTSDGSSDVVANRTAVLVDAGSYTSTWRLTATEGGTVTSETAYTSGVDYVNERSHFQSSQTSGGETASGWEVYSAGDVTYNRYGEGEAASYVVGEGTFTGTTPFDAGSYVARGGDLAEFERAGTETFDGVGVTRYVLTERPSWIAAQQLAEDDVRWTEFTFEVLVDDDNLVRAERWTSTGTQDGVTHTIEFSYEITGVGATTVDEPAWVGTAREQNEA